MHLQDAVGQHAAAWADALGLEQRYKVRGVNFGWKAKDQKAYQNKRAEMWGAMKQKSGLTLLPMCQPTPKQEQFQLEIQSLGKQQLNFFFLRNQLPNPHGRE